MMDFWSWKWFSMDKINRYLSRFRRIKRKSKIEGMNGRNTGGEMNLIEREIITEYVTI